MNVENLRACVKYFEDEPLRLKMQDWVGECNPNYINNPPCGTVACLCGSAMILEAKRLNLTGVFNVLQLHENYEEFGMRYFDINKAQAVSLFYVNNWPTFLANFYYELDIQFNRNRHPHVSRPIKNLMVWVLRERVELFIQENYIMNPSTGTLESLE